VLGVDPSTVAVHASLCALSPPLPRHR
jgi:hypothetical protein